MTQPVTALARVKRVLTVLDTDRRPSAVALSGAMSFAIRGDYPSFPHKPHIALWALDITAEARIVWC